MECAQVAGEAAAGGGGGNGSGRGGPQRPEITMRDLDEVGRQLSGF